VTATGWRFGVLRQASCLSALPIVVGLLAYGLAAACGGQVEVRAMVEPAAGSTGRIFISYRREETAYPAGRL
jgi:hypothetical protein